MYGCGGGRDRRSCNAPGVKRPAGLLALRIPVPPVKITGILVLTILIVRIICVGRAVTYGSGGGRIVVVDVVVVVGLDVVVVELVYFMTRVAVTLVGVEYTYREQNCNYYNGKRGK